MEKLLQEIDLLATEIKSDSNRSKLVDLTHKLIELSKVYWEAKSEYTKLKNKYENEVLMETESFRWYFEDLYQREYEKELDNNPKAKKNKVTNVECETQAKLKCLWMKKEMEEQQVIVVYLDPIIRSYYEFINAIKFQDRETIKMEQQIKRIDDDLPF